MGFLRDLFGKNVTTDVLEVLEAQHQEVDKLIAMLEEGKGDRRAVFLELANNLAAHAAVEEQLFYPFVMTADTSELLYESVEEHLAIRRVLADMVTMKLDDDQFLAKLALLREQVSHHAHEEEEKALFPKVRRMFTVEERAGLGNDVIAKFEELIQQDPYRNLPAETTAAAELPAR
jgi:hemerythrin superfamily protein